MTRNTASILQRNLHQLMSSQEKTRRQALNEVGTLLCNEGFVSDDTAESVPFLIKLLDMPHVKGKDRILTLLANIAWADSDVTWRWHEEGGTGKRPVTDEHLAVGAGLETYLALFHAPNTVIQLQATRVLAQFPERAQELSSHLTQAYIQAQHVEIQANLLLALGELWAPLEGDHDEVSLRQRPSDKNEAWMLCENVWHTAPHELLTFCAALVLARFTGKNTSQEVVSLLRNIMLSQHLPDSLDLFSQLPCARGYSQNVVIAATLALKELE